MFKKKIIQLMQEEEQKQNESSPTISSRGATSKRRTAKGKKQENLDKYLQRTNTVQSEINQLLTEECKDQQNKIEKFKSLLKLKKKRIGELKLTMKQMRLKMESLQQQNVKISTSLEANIKKRKFLFNQNNKLKRMNNILQTKIKTLKEQYEENDTQDQNARGECEQNSISSMEPNCTQMNSSLTSDEQRLSESNSHLKNIQHCLATAHMDSTEITEISRTRIGNNESNNGPPPKRLKTDKNVTNIYNKNVLKKLVTNLEFRHSEKYDLWRNVLWALHQYGLETGYDTLDIADAFSIRSLKYKSLEDVKKTFEASDGTKSLQYLIDISKIYEDGLDRLTNYLSTIVPEEFLPLSIKEVDFRDRCKIQLTVHCVDESYVWFIIPHLYVLIDQSGKRLNFLKSKIVSQGSALVSLCAEMKNGFTATLYPERYEFRAKRTKLVLNHPRDAQNAFITHPNGKRGVKPFDIRTIRLALREEAFKLLSKKSGKEFDYEDDDYIYDVDDIEPNSKRSDVALIEAVFNADPELSTRYKSTGNAIYHCNLQTNVWYKVSDKTFDYHLANYFNNLIKLTHSEQKYINKKYSNVKLRNLFLGQVEDLNFVDKLNSKLRLFVTNDRTIDPSSYPPVNRRIQIEDLAETTSGWSYNPELSARYKESVQSYFNKLFPLQSEREWVLSFLARLLNGEKTGEPFLILVTDEREGKTGKSTFKSLLRAVFGNYYLANTKVIVNRGSQERNTYDAGLHCLKEKRLLIADDLQKTDSLNCGFIKAITGESNYSIKDKIYRSAREFEFPVQAGLVILSNESNMAKFDKSDRDFIKRLVACPMRSRFVSEEEYAELHTANTYVADASIKAQIPEWKSATLDLLIKYYRESMPNLPDSIAACKKRMSELYPGYEDWMDAHIYRTDSEGAFITARDIMARMNRSKDYFNPYEVRKLKSDMADWAARNGFEYKARHVYPDKKKKRRESKSAILKATFEITTEE